MESYRYQYISAQAEAGSGYVGVIFERQGGTQFVVLLSTADAQRLIQELPEQLPIATEKPI